MPQHLRPTRLELRKVPRPARAQGADIGNLHVIDYHLYHATLDLIAYGSCYTLFEPNKITHISPSRIGRYLDGEEETEGTYR